MNIDLRCGDCFDLLPSIPDGSVDLLLTDPPYGITACDWDVKPDIKSFFREGWRVLKPNGALIVFGTVKSGIDWILESRKEFRYDLVWEKTCAPCFVQANVMPLRIHELCFVFYRSKPVYNPQKYDTGKGGTHIRVQKDNRSKCLSTVSGYIQNITSERLYKSLFRFSNFNGAGFENDHKHTTQKPVPLMELLIKMYSSEGETVLDPFMGSGTTGVAAKLNGRNFIGFEKDKTFFEVATRRIGETPDNYEL